MSEERKLFVEKFRKRYEESKDKREWNKILFEFGYNNHYIYRSIYGEGFPNDKCHIGHLSNDNQYTLIDESVYTTTTKEFFCKEVDTKEKIFTKLNCEIFIDRKVLYYNRNSRGLVSVITILHPIELDKTNIFIPNQDSTIQETKKDRYVTSEDIKDLLIDLDKAKVFINGIYDRVLNMVKNVEKI